MLLSHSDGGANEGDLGRTGREAAGTAPADFGGWGLPARDHLGQLP